MIACVGISQVFCSRLSVHPRGSWEVWPYSLLSRLGNVLVRFEEGADVHSLAAPDIAMDGPIEGELEGAAVEVSGRHVRPGHGEQWL